MPYYKAYSKLVIACMHISYFGSRILKTIFKITKLKMLKDMAMPKDKIIRQTITWAIF